MTLSWSAEHRHVGVQHRFQNHRFPSAADTIMVGDRMDTDVVAGLESGLKTALVLTGVSTRADMERFPFRPDHVIESLADLGEILMKE
nr:HAD hydrolase-like protein [Mesorhizobium sp. M7A.F.Ca.MR.245.00.0.0]